MKRLLTALVWLASALGCHGAVELAAWSTVGEVPLVVLRDRVTRAASPWLQIGQSWRSYTVTSFDVATRTITVEAPGRRLVLPGTLDEGPPERFVTLRARVPAGFASKPFESLVLKTPSGETYATTWSPGTIHQPPVLIPGELCDFVLIERYSWLPGAPVWHDVWKVSAKGRLLFDAGTCEIHGVTLAQKEVPTRHGYTPLNLARTDARRRLFPHAESGRATTCMPDEGEPPTHLILVCSRCETAYRQWSATSETPAAGKVSR